MLVEINKANLQIHLNLVQAYEAEFSLITGKRPKESGLFDLDTYWGGSIKGYLWFEQNSPVGFILFDTKSSPQNVNEYYVVPSCRYKKIGQKMFFEVLKKFPGEWQVKQIQGADKAKTFWRKIIKEYTNDNFSEEVYLDKDWGQVTRQLFKTH